jgi:tRNA-modifying protein YgfZ
MVSDSTGTVHSTGAVHTISSPNGESAVYRALEMGAVLFDRSDRSRIKIGGIKAGEMVTGLVTNDVVSLQPGHGQYAAVLSGKGKILTDMRVLRVEDGVITDTPAASGSVWADTVRKYINPRVAPHKNVSAELGDIGVFGTHSAELISRVFQLQLDSIEQLEPFSNRVIKWNGADVIVVRTPELEPLPGYDLMVSSEEVTSLIVALSSAGGVGGDGQAWEIARVEAGRPAWGQDMDDTTLAQEANLDQLHAISYTKGCYLGQETVARIHFRGHVNRCLRRLHLLGSALPPRGAELIDDEQKLVGTVTSAVQSPRYGGIGIGMVRREVTDASWLEMRWSGGEGRARVEVLGPLGR